MTADTRDHPGVVAPPPLIYLGSLAVGAGLDWAWPLSFPFAAIPAGARYSGGATTIALGLVLMAIAIGQFRKAGTNIQTRHPTMAIVTDGVYRYSRNPIYLGLSLIYAGIGIAVGGAWVLALLVPLLAVIRFGVIAREEGYLERKFGDDYRRYKAAVRRWL